MTVYAKARRARKKKLNYKKPSFVIFFIISFVAILYFIISGHLIVSSNNDSASDLNSVAEASEPSTEATEPENVESEPADETSDMEIPASMGGYRVLGQLVIDKIGISKPVLTPSEDASLNLSVAELCGPDEINSIGNFCVIGHNWPSMIKKVLDLEVGDTFYMVNRNTKSKVTYKIYNVYSCYPNELSCLYQNTAGKREVTLITCNPGAVTRRICKAREI